MNRVFISHSSPDKASAQAFATALQEQGVEYWVGEQNLNLGSDIIASINDAISKSSGVVFLLSESSNDKTWLSSEVALALSKKKMVFPIVISDNAKVPLLLRNYKYLVVSKVADFARAAQEIAKILKAVHLSTTDEHEDLILRLESALARKELIEKEREIYSQFSELNEREFKRKGISSSIVSISIAISIAFLGLLFNSTNQEFNQYGVVAGLILGFVSSELLHFYNKHSGKEKSEKEVR